MQELDYQLKVVFMFRCNLYDIPYQKLTAKKAFLAAFFCFTTLLPQTTLAQDCMLYRYQAEITKVYDADTITADVDLGFHTWRKGEKLRLYGINAPEVRGIEKPEGIVARDALRARILGKNVTICTIKASKSRRIDKRGKYGRYLAKIYLDGENINDWLVAKGFAEYRNY
ncbi:MAG: thermonuclease family protein [Rhizobiaceae bacterium]|nr:thermonuclease family protein [Rhizobiaceae bacterium]